MVAALMPKGVPASIPQASLRFPGFAGRSLLRRVVTEGRRASMGGRGNPRAGALSALLADVEEGRLSETNRAPSWSATRAAPAGYHHRRGDGGGREAA